MSRKLKQGRLLLQCDYSDDSDYVGDILLEVSSIMRRKSKSGCWYVRVENFGWQKKNGFSYIKSLTGREFMGKILPQTECTWKMFNYGKGIIIQNWHHDSNTGDEKYYCYPVSQNTYNKETK